MPIAQDTFGGRDYAELLSGDATLDGITSTTDTTISTEAIEVPEGWVGLFVIDVDAFTTAAVTASVKVAFDGGTEFNQFYFDGQSATAATVALAAAGAYTLKILNPFPYIAASGTDGKVVFRVDMETDGADSSLEYGKCFYAVAPRVQGALLEGVPA
jgi:hypothetical protein